MASEKRKQNKKTGRQKIDNNFLRIKELYDAGRITFEEVSRLTEISAKNLQELLAPEKIVKTVLVTGGAGFIGSNFVQYILQKYPDYSVINFDKLTYAGNLDNLRYIENDPRYKFVKGDVASVEDVDKVFSENKIDYVVNFAAETHVERSIYSAREFVITNTLGVQTLLDAINKYKAERMVQVSTDESYGTLEIDDGKSFSEESPLQPNVPYSAAKAGGDLMCRAYWETHKTPVIVTHCTNNYGQYQYPEKVIPLFTLKAVKKDYLPIHGRGQHVRDWLFVKDHCSAIDMILHKGNLGEIYNIGSGTELPTIEIAHKVLETLGRPKSLIKFIDDRPGNDLRYSLHTQKLRNTLGWKPEFSFEKYLGNTTEWYLNNPQWVSNVKMRMDDFGKTLKI